MSHPAPQLVVIDVATKTYQRFVGNERTHAVKSDYALYPEEVENFRTDPAAMLGEDEDSDEAA